MTINEWYYLIGRDGNSKRSNKCAFATIANKYYGMVLIPDNWSKPSDVFFTAGGHNGYETNNYSVEEWSKMESSGAIFLPTGGCRFEKDVDYLTEGYYWSSTMDDEEVRALCILSGDYGPSYWGASAGFSVRLIKDI